MYALFADFSVLDMGTLVLMSAVLYVSLTIVMFYAYRYRKTYPGFGAFTLGQAAWCAGLLAIHFRLFGIPFALTVGNLLLMLHAAFWYYGLALYGGMDRIKTRAGLNFGLAVLADAVLAYYVYARFDTCKRIMASAFARNKHTFLRFAGQPDYAPADIEVIARVVAGFVEKGLGACPGENDQPVESSL